MRVGFDCEDSLMLQWNKMPAVKNYEVAALDNNQFVPLAFGPDSALVLDKATLKGNTLALQPYFDGGKPAIRSYSVDYTTQLAGCFLRTFTALPQPPDGIALHATLGTTYGVEQVTFERFDGVNYSAIGTTPTTQTTVGLVDASPREGLNLHRVRLTLSNGGTVVSDEVANLYLRELPYLVFPNPVASDEPLGIVVRDAGASDTRVELYNRDGSLVFSQYLLSGEEYVTLHNVTPGLYLFAISTGTGIHRGKLVVR
ncbi:MAG: T9SS type A sorting domain-containing protein [Bacteroidia bacterium]|nr:T9SS type A sorting domain-containing protein [Bacteroidia bacterium]